MLETVITLKPHVGVAPRDDVVLGLGAGVAEAALRPVTPDHISAEQLVNELNEALKLPGVSNAWTMPIKARIDMLTTGIRTPVGLKVSGADLQRSRTSAPQIEALCRRAGHAQRVRRAHGGGYFLDFEWKRDELARYGLSIEEAQAVVQNAIGGENVTTTVEGRERYPVNVRYLRDFRSDLERLSRVLVPAIGTARRFPRADRRHQGAAGPAMIRTKNGPLTGYVYVDVAGRDIGSYVEEAKRLVREKVQLPVGYTLVWSGQYENMARVRAA